MEIEGIPVAVIDDEDLLRNKRAADREADRVDVQMLEKRRHQP